MKKILIILIVLIFVSISAYAGINDGLIAYYPFNGNANDESGNGHNGVVYGATLTTDRFDNANRAYRFNSAYSNYINVPHNPLDLSPKYPTSFSMAVWIKTSNQSTRGWILSTDPDGAGCNHGFHLLIESSGEVGFYIDPTINCGDGYSVYALNQYNDSGWHLIVGTYDNDLDSYLKIYVDGILKKQKPSLGYNPTKEYIIIGALRYSGGVNSFFDGSIDDIRIYNRILSDEEILSLYNEGLTTST
jgi:hypothetical protein